MPTKSTRKPVRSLAQFRIDKKRAKCPVCSLPKSIRKQMRDAREHGVRRAEVLVWLIEECQATVTDVDLSRHVGGRHDA